MTQTESLIGTLVSGLVLWAITKAIAYFVKASRIRAALLEDVQINVVGAKEQLDAVKKLVEDNVIEGQKLPFPIPYSIGEYLLYKSMQSDLPLYLKKAEIIKVVKFYQALWEMDVSIAGFASVLGKWEERGIALTREQVAHARKRKERIDSLCGILTSMDIRGFSDLPDDYRSVKGPEHVVGKA
ncbi:MAG: hypothetical protein K8F27_05090 [Sulfuricellaceae bacterium]|nr:hypothetical protein [Sulfuricellaceae bacterium]